MSGRAVLWRRRHKTVAMTVRLWLSIAVILICGVEGGFAKGEWNQAEFVGRNNLILRHKSALTLSFFEQVKDLQGVMKPPRDQFFIGNAGHKNHIEFASLGFFQFFGQFIGCHPRIADFVHVRIARKQCLPHGVSFDRIAIFGRFSGPRKDYSRISGGVRRASTAAEGGYFCKQVNFNGWRFPYVSKSCFQRDVCSKFINNEVAKDSNVCG
jgi:hypothetical protein